MKNIAHIIQQVQVNIPFTMLYETHLDAFIENGLNPEIGLDAAALDRFSYEDFSRIAKKFHKNSRTVTLHGPFIDLNSGSPDSAVRRLTGKRFEQVLELVPLFEPKSVVCHAGYDAKRYDYFKDTWVENSLELWSRLASRLAENGSRLMLENVYEDGPEDIQILFERLADRGVGFCLDTGHAAAFSQSDLEIWLQTLGPYLGQLHLHDNFGNSDAHLAIGSGKIDFSKIFNYLKKNRNTTPIITLEPHRETELWSSLDYLAKAWPW
ncbi:MAG: sugar phosphate isomerase/epimerase [Desulfobacterales bacterium]|nr:MAG: sugar phosphate isomerase/epimerase [Desulfobacterales bacterium]